MDKIIEDTDHLPLNDVSVECEKYYVVDQRPMIFSLVGILCCCMAICYCNVKKKACFAENKVT